MSRKVRRLRYTSVEYDSAEFDGLSVTCVVPAIWVVFKKEPRGGTATFEARYASEIVAHLEGRLIDLNPAVMIEPSGIRVTTEVPSALPDVLDVVVQEVAVLEMEFAVLTAPGSRRKAEAVAHLFTRLSRDEQQVCYNEITNFHLGPGWARVLPDDEGDGREGQ